MNSLKDDDDDDEITKLLLQHEKKNSDSSKAAGGLTQGKNKLIIGVARTRKIYHWLLPIGLNLGSLSLLRDHSYIT